MLVFFRDVRQPVPKDRKSTPGGCEYGCHCPHLSFWHRRLTDRLFLSGPARRPDRTAQQTPAGGSPAASCGLRETVTARASVLLLDLDGFKYVNDTLGHQAGDQVLVEVSCRLRSVIRQADTLARVGVTSFCLVLSDVRKVNDALKIAQTCLDSLRKPILIAGRDYSLSASIGISCYPEHGVEPAALQQHADTAMYHAKFNGKNGFQVFTSEINAQLL